MSGRGKPKTSEVESVPLGYAPVPPEMLAYRKEDGSRLSTLAVFAWCALAMHRSIETGQAFPSNKTLAGILGTDQRSVKRAIAELVKAGFLLRSEQERNGETGRYSLTVYTIAVEGEPVVVGLKKKSETGGHRRHPDRGASSPRPGGIVGNGKEDSKKEEYSRRDADASSDEEKQEPSAFEFMGQYADLLNDAMSLSGRERGKLAKALQKQLDAGDNPKKLRTALCRMVTRRQEGYRLELEDVLNDVSDNSRKPQADRESYRPKKKIL